MENENFRRQLSGKFDPRIPAGHIEAMRFSLGTLLLACALIGVGVSMFKSNDESAALRKQIEALKVDAGYPDVQDENRCYAKRIDTNNETFWKFRIYLPKGHKFQAFRPSDVSGPTFKSPGHFEAIVRLIGDDRVLTVDTDEMREVLRTTVPDDAWEMMRDRLTEVTVKSCSADHENGVPLLHLPDASGRIVFVGFRPYIGL